MLTINDLHQNGELSSSNMRKVAGGNDVTKAFSDVEMQFGVLFATLHCDKASEICFETAGQLHAAGRNPS
ncbi:MAG: hypothetical protein ACLPSY_11120 [Steroidobacteraceae bacterium]